MVTAVSMPGQAEPRLSSQLITTLVQLQLK